MKSAGWVRASCVAELDELVDVPAGKVVRQVGDLMRGLVDRARDRGRIALELGRRAVDGVGEAADRLHAARFLGLARLAELVPDILGELARLLADGLGGGLRGLLHARAQRGLTGPLLAPAAQLRHSSGDVGSGPGGPRGRLHPCARRCWARTPLALAARFGHSGRDVGSGAIGRGRNGRARDASSLQRVGDWSGLAGCARSRRIRHEKSPWSIADLNSAA